ncbi:subtilase-type protease inhibitor [Actinoplanes sp. KI2]|uniref:subtilase-type protease inhibitor n=1 Tax=Actinoplanes sp. KI2 TaxID=2983315 RepID=UPI0021D59B9E|nr:subtilase-type protease inhibitor [Actinoplanes sp. KI2]MCU7730113.1 subtilase-type protease inhibitor [Actinoplanes sp. KI2]
MIPIHHIGILATSLSTTAALIAPGTPAAAAPTAPAPDSTLVLAVLPADPGGVPPRLATLECDPDGGSYAAAGSACDDLRLVDGDIAALTDDGGICTRVYQPVTAIAVGTWEGNPVAYRETFSNRCVLLHATGDVFDF